MAANQKTPWWGWLILLVVLAACVLFLPSETTEQQAPKTTAPTATAKVIKPATLSGEERVWDLPSGKVTIPNPLVGERKTAEPLCNTLREGIWFRENYFGFETTFFGDKDGTLWEVELVDHKHMPYLIVPTLGGPYWVEWRRWYFEEYLPRQTKSPPAKK